MVILAAHSAFQLARKLVLISLISCGPLARVHAQPFLFSTVAGRPGLRSVDGTNSSALFGYPVGIARDAAADLFIADFHNNTIRRLSLLGTNWVLTTLAGLTGQSGTADGTNSDARFNNPLDIAVDSATNLYVADTYNNAIRKIAPVGTNWVVSTWAGTANPALSGAKDGTGGAASFFIPAGIASDGAGNIYVADSAYGLIRKVVPSGSFGKVTTLAGGFSLGGGFADGTNRNALFKNPSGIAVDSQTNLYVADSGNHALRKLTLFGSNWVVTTPAGTPGVPGSTDGTNNSAQFDSPDAVAVDNAENVYVADTANYTLRLITPLGTNFVVSTLAGLPSTPGSSDGTNSDARFMFPVGLVGDGAANLWVADSANCAVREVSPAGTNFVVRTIAGSPDARRTDGTNTGATFWNPSGMARDQAGNIYVADAGNNTVRRIAAAGTNRLVTTLAGLPGCAGTQDGTNAGARFNGPVGIVVDTTTNIYVSDTQNHTIRKLSPAGADWVVTTLAGLPGTSGAVDGTNSSARFFNPAGLALDSAGNLLVCDQYNNAIRMVSPLGTNWVVTTVAGVASLFSRGFADGTNGTARFAYPSAIAAGLSGNFYISDLANARVRSLIPAGTNWVVTTIAGGSVGSADGTNTAAQFNLPQGICADSSGNLFVADSQNRTLRKLAPAGTNWVVTTVGGLAGSSGTNDALGTRARFALPYGITADPLGNLWVADSLNDTIRLGQLLPALQISALANKAILSWPLLATNVILETSPSLDPSAVWTPVSDSIITNPAGFFLTNNATDTAFFRLRKP